jgi:hypothetical protein
MTTIFSDLIDECEIMLNDVTHAVWTRNLVTHWCKEAMLAFPILRPQQMTYTFLSAGYSIPMATDFREMLSVEYPVDESPPKYLQRMNRHDEDFFDGDTHYDVDYDYVDGVGWVLWTSHEMQSGDEVYINYLANHATNIDDDDTDTITVNDEHVPIIVCYVIWKAYNERLSVYMQQPTAYSQVVTQMNIAVQDAHERYQKLVALAQARLAAGRPSPKMKMDDFDRVY